MWRRFSLRVRSSSMCMRIVSIFMKWQIHNYDPHQFRNPRKEPHG